MDISFQHFEHFCNILVSFILVSFVTCSILKEIKKIFNFIVIINWLLHHNYHQHWACGAGTRISRDCAKIWRCSWSSNYLSDSQTLSLKFRHMISGKTHDLSLIPAGITNSKANSSQYRNKSKFFVKSKEIFT